MAEKKPPRKTIYVFKCPRPGCHGLAGHTFKEAPLCDVCGARMKFLRKREGDK